MTPVQPAVAARLAGGSDGWILVLSVCRLAVPRISLKSRSARATWLQHALTRGLAPEPGAVCDAGLPRGARCSRRRFRPPWSIWAGRRSCCSPLQSGHSTAASLRAPPRQTQRPAAARAAVRWQRLLRWPRQRLPQGSPRRHRQQRCATSVRVLLQLQAQAQVALATSSARHRPEWHALPGLLSGALWPAMQPLPPSRRGRSDGGSSKPRYLATRSSGSSRIISSSSMPPGWCSACRALCAAHALRAVPAASGPAALAQTPQAVAAGLVPCCVHRSSTTCTRSHRRREGWLPGAARRRPPQAVPQSSRHRPQGQQQQRQARWQPIRRHKSPAAWQHQAASWAAARALLQRSWR